MDHADLRCLDMATGSGCIALSLAEALPESTIVGVDLSNDALKWAKHNAEKSSFKQGKLGVLGSFGVADTWSGEMGYRHLQPSLYRDS